MENSQSSNEYYKQMEDIWTNNYPSVSSIKELDDFYKEFFPDISIEILLDQVVQHSSLLKNNNRILEFGCDNGIMLNYFKKYNLELFGIDINGKSIVEGHQKFPELNLIKSFGLNIPFQDNYFDILFASAVLKHIRYEDREKVYGEFSRVSKYIIVWEKNSTEERIEEMSGFTFYHSNFKKELELFFKCHKVIEIGDDILGLYEKK
jgi:ubiquinone/menaquinone biosynthesis C-methylase UbiE